MLEIEEEVVGSHQTDEETSALGDAFAAFDLDALETDEEEVPAKEQTPEPKVEKVKHNKAEVDVDISTTEKLHDHLQRSLALDKERERKNEYEKNLERVAKLQGYKDHAELIANLDQLEQQQQKQEQSAFGELKENLRQEFVDNGFDPDLAMEYVENHPLVKEAERIKQEQEASQTESDKLTIQKEWVSRWESLYQKYPDLVEESKAFERGEEPAFYTADMKARVEKGYDPIDAYELAHRERLTVQTKKATEQRLIKEQHLGLRSKVETMANPDNEPSVPTALASAFAAFDLPESAAKK